MFATWRNLVCAVLWCGEDIQAQSANCGALKRLFCCNFTHRLCLFLLVKDVKGLQKVHLSFVTITTALSENSAKYLGESGTC